MIKFLAILISSVLLLSLAACGDGTTQSNSGNNITSSTTAPSTVATLALTSAPPSSPPPTDMASQPPSVNDNNSFSAAPAINDDNSLEGILININDDFVKTITHLTDELNTVYETIGDSYGGYIENKQSLFDWYSLVQSESNALFSRTTQKSTEYYKLITSSSDTNNDDAYDAADSAMDDYYDEVYDGAFDDYYDEIYDGLFDDVYDKYYDGIIDDAHDTVEYADWLDVSSECYKNWLESSSDTYSLWLDSSSAIYKNWLNVSSAFISGNYDIDSILQETSGAQSDNVSEQDSADNGTTDIQSNSVTDDSPQDITDDTTEPQTITENTAVTEQFVIDTSWYSEDNSAICDGVYLVGEDITEGNYIFTCTNSPYSTQITVFESQEKYGAYHKTSRFTNGEEDDAINANALSNEYIRTDEQYALNLKGGNVLMIEGGRGTLLLASGDTAESTEAVTGNAMSVVTGVYQAGDIESGTYILSCLQSDYALDVVVFANKEAYDKYMSADRFTNGEESAAVEQNAWSDFYIKQGESCYINCTADSVLKIDNGIGQLEPVSMGWAK